MKRRAILIALVVGVVLVGGYILLQNGLNIFADAGTKTKSSDGTLHPVNQEGCKSTTVTASRLKNPIACVETNLGTFEFVLYLDKTPITAQNFISLAEKGFYDGLPFQWVNPDSWIQGGDPSGTGRGGPGYTIKDEFISELKHSDAGVVAMTKGKTPDSGGSQFYVTLAAAHQYDGVYVVFGHVIEGLDVVFDISEVKSDPTTKQPVDKVIMKKVTIIHPKTQ